MKVKVLEVTDLWVRYPIGDWVLRGLDLQVSRGEVVLIVGETGSGKSTLARAISGLAETVYNCEVKGRIIVEGLELSEGSYRSLAGRIVLIGQNPYLYFTEPLVGDDLYSYALKVYGEEQLASKAFSRTLEVMGVGGLRERYFFELSGGEARRALVAKALISNPTIFIFDEPLMWLDDLGVEDYVRLIGELKELGRTVIILEHRFMPLLRHVDRVYALRGGKLIDASSVATRALEKIPLQHLGNQRLKKSVEDGDVVLEARDVYFKYNGGGNYVLRGVNLQVRRGEVVLIYGLNGQGKTTLLKVLAGYLRPQKGRVLRRGDVLYIPQNILLFYTESTIEREVVELFKSRGMKSQVEPGLELVKGLGINPKSSPLNLSHGQMVKLAISLASTLKVDVVLLDEPFSGLTYEDRLRLLEQVANSNAAILVATSNLDAIGAQCWNKLYKLEDGTLVEMSDAGGTPLVYASKLYREIVGANHA